jgi:hypothetical protein
MISDFPAKKDYNPGGYLSFQFAPAQLVASFPMIANSKTVVPVAFLAGYDWFNGYATTETLVFNEEPAFDEGGTYYNITVTGFAPGDKPELVDLIGLMADNRFILQVKDTAKINRLVGTPKSPLDFSATFGSGGARADQKGFTFNFTGQALYRAPVYVP